MSEQLPTFRRFIVPTSSGPSSIVLDRSTLNMKAPRSSETPRFCVTPKINAKQDVETSINWPWRNHDPTKRQTLLDPEDEGITVLRNVKTLLDPEDEGTTIIRNVKTLLDPEDEGTTILRNVKTLLDPKMKAPRFSETSKLCLTLKMKASRSSET